MRVVLIDDDHRMLGLIDEVLTEDGFDVVATAGSVNDALGIIHTDADVVVIDYVLPDGDGLDVAETIRESRPEQPVVIFSSLFDRRLQRDVEELGLRYVEKVAGIDALESAIRGDSR